MFDFRVDLEAVVHPAMGCVILAPWFRATSDSEGLVYACAALRALRRVNRG